MLGFKVLEPGMFSTFQDKGRLGHQSKGIPISGAMDMESMTIANKLVGQNQAVLEMTYSACKLEFLKSMAIAVTGADMLPLINGSTVSMYKTIKVKRGDVLSFKGLQSGFRSYIAFSDDLQLDALFDSCSTYIKIGCGGYKGRALKKGDEISVSDKIFDGHYQVIAPDRSNKVRVILSYEHESFKRPADFFEQSFEVTNDLDRMGIRLKGNPLEHIETADIISSPIIPGAIQIPKSGQPMVMLRDAQTIGGYTRIGSVISCDLDKLAQVKPGDKITFVEVTQEEALDAKLKWLKSLNELNYNDDRRHLKVSVNGKPFDVYVEEI